MAKPPYEEIVCNYDGVPDDRRHEILHKWNYGVAELILNRISNLPVYLQTPVLEEIKKDIFNS